MRLESTTVTVKNVEDSNEEVTAVTVSHMGPTCHSNNQSSQQQQDQHKRNNLVNTFKYHYKCAIFKSVNSYSNAE